MKKCKLAIKLGNEMQDMQKCRLGTQINAIPKAIGKTMRNKQLTKSKRSEENKASYAVLQKMK